jgi:hypothetical protein
LRPAERALRPQQGSEEGGETPILLAEEPGVTVSPAGTIPSEERAAPSTDDAGPEEHGERPPDERPAIARPPFIPEPASPMSPLLDGSPGMIGRLPQSVPLSRKADAQSGPLSRPSIPAGQRETSPFQADLRVRWPAAVPERISRAGQHPQPGSGERIESQRSWLEHPPFLPDALPWIAEREPARQSGSAVQASFAETPERERRGTGAEEPATWVTDALPTVPYSESRAVPELALARVGSALDAPPLQRNESEGTGEDAVDAQAAPDLDMLARQVYPLIRRMISIERERRLGGR